MEKLLQLLSLKNKEETNTDISQNEKITYLEEDDIYKTPRLDIPHDELLSISKDTLLKDNSLSNLRNIDYSRNKFNYDTFSSIGWWPDKILRLIEINRIHYIPFIQHFENNASICDTAIRNAIFFMNQPPYCKLHYINKFISYRTTNISDCYIRKVIEEDNCYMEGITDHYRSNNETQHYYLLKGLTELLSYNEIKIDDLKLKKQYIEKLNLFVGIYNLKNLSAMIDDIMRNILKSTINKDNLNIFLPKIYLDIISELDINVIKYAKISNYEYFIDKAYCFRDIIYYAFYKSSLCSQTFIGTHSLIKKIYNEDNIIVYNIIYYDKFKQMFNKKNRYRIFEVYNYYNKKIMKKEKQLSIIIQHNNFDNLLKSHNKLSETESLTPKYKLIPEPLFNNKNNMFPIYYINDTINNTKEQIKRRSSTSLLISSINNSHIDTNK